MPKTGLIKWSDSKGYKQDINENNASGYKIIENIQNKDDVKMAHIINRKPKVWSWTMNLEWNVQMMQTSLVSLLY